MGIPLGLIVNAVMVATKVLVAVRSTNSASAQQSELVSLIDDVSKKIDALSSGLSAELGYQLEKQQLEKLSALSKVVKLALELGHQAMLGTAVASISEQIEYSRLRLREGKYEWLGPWMIAESVRIEALRIMAADERGLDAVRRETLAFRIHILDHVGRLLVGATDSPWLKIADFVEGRNEALLLSLSDVAELQPEEAQAEEAQAEAESQPDEAAPAPAAKTTLAPSRSWPFPTSSRP
jgi:hypothetical protein